MSLHIVKPDAKRKKWQIRGPLHSGKVVKLPGDRDKRVAEKMRDNIAALDRAARFGELPPPSLAPWIAGLSEKEAARYVQLGLLDRKILETRKPTVQLLEEFRETVRVRCKSDSHAPDTKFAQVTRIMNAIGTDVRLTDLTSTKVVDVVNRMTAETGRWKGKPLSQKTRCEYFTAIKAFGEWMVKERRAASNPLSDLEVSGAYRAPVRKRRPLTLTDFQKLVAYLASAPDRYPHQNLDWTPKDRLLIYWTAVMTGLRFKELRSLTPAHLNFSVNPVTVTVDGWVAKNSHTATVPIGDELATALKVHAAGLPANSPLLKIPENDAMRLAFYRDLDAAGIRRKFDDGSAIDFHTLRSTAICWWLTENKLSLLLVQHRARLLTLELVQKYVDDFLPKHADLVQGTPSIYAGSAIPSRGNLVQEMGAHSGAQ